ncbi:hypothetical protein G9A89_021774 [Geosiphon pyriformis]|nr:hypothetical protein G9A89_021774 [Geosiphon pyriformis]
MKSKFSFLTWVSNLHRQSAAMKLLTLFNTVKDDYQSDAKISEILKKWSKAQRYQYQEIFELVEKRRHNVDFIALLAYLYNLGIGTLVDEQKAFFWYKQSASLVVDPFVQYKIGWCYQNGFGVDPDHHLAFVWYRRSAVNGFPAAQYQLANCYRQGFGTKISVDDALYWYTKSAKGGYGLGQGQLAMFYRYGVGTPVNHLKAFEWFKAAAEKGHTLSQLHLGDFYRDGKGTLINENEAFRWYKASANGKNADAAVRLANCYFDGCGVAKNDYLAFVWSSKAAMAGNSVGLLYVGDCYREGIGTRSDYLAAYRCYKQSAAIGNKVAQERLKLCKRDGIVDQVTTPAKMLYDKGRHSKGLSDMGRETTSQNFPSFVSVNIPTVRKNPNRRTRLLFASTKKRISFRISAFVSSTFKKRKKTFLKSGVKNNGQSEKFKPDIRVVDVEPKSKEYLDFDPIFIPHYNLENFEFDTENGFSLCGVLQIKKQPQKEGAIVLCHGLRSTKEFHTLSALTERLPYHTIVFDFQGNGESGGTTNYGNYFEEVSNLQKIISYTRKILQLNVISTIGHSRGAAVVLLYASRYQDVPLVVSISAPYDFAQASLSLFTYGQLKELQEKGTFFWAMDGQNEDREYFIRQEDLKKRAALDMSITRNINKAKVRVLTVHGSEDETCPIQGAYKYDQLLGPEPHHQLTIIDGLQIKKRKLWENIQESIMINWDEKRDKNQNLAKACEKTCRIGISTTFSEKYAIATSQIWDDFYNDLAQTPLPTLNIGNSLAVEEHPVLISKIVASLVHEAKNFSTIFNSRLPTVIEDSIFKKTPQFRGDCNHPFRVKQPKLPQIWKMDDCEKMDYICGNPPSICHFLDMIKKRNVDSVNEVLATAVSGEFLDILLHGVRETLDRVDILEEVNVDLILEVMKSDLSSRLAGFAQDYRDNFCAENSCDQYDLEIKTQLLTYP